MHYYMSAINFVLIDKNFDLNSVLNLPTVFKAKEAKRRDYLLNTEYRNKSGGVHLFTY